MAACLYITAPGSTVNGFSQEDRLSRTSATPSRPSRVLDGLRPNPGEIKLKLKRSCFPALDFLMPQQVPSSLKDDWWCSQMDEYAFLGFSYAVDACQDRSTLSHDFKKMKREYGARYIRLYSSCDKPDFNDDLIEAAWDAGVGLHMLIWFGFDGDDLWKGRKEALIQSIKQNPKGPHVVRAVVVGSEPMYDWVMPQEQLADQVREVKSRLADFTGRGDAGMQVTLSDMPYGFQLQGGAPDVFEAVDINQANVLPFLDPTAGAAADSWHLVENSYNYFAQRNKGKKVYFTQTGWPSDDAVWKANSKGASANVDEEKAYFDLLDSRCEWMKAKNGGGVGWFAQIYSDAMLPGWGVLDFNMKVS
ncbi:glycoside hydrolase family 17 protein [Violaceomyces palustris]|uniref:Glycoside hydrolase family 17 protein n=1 Tax=Violaceomyces palustris TaxID=1673888 RepID=A0ACD0NMU5_9BASI|nr:glycoside hydrolase family 17 protein [Violaceomyces palustris]